MEGYPEQPYPQDLERAQAGLQARRFQIAKQISALTAEWDFNYALEVDFRYEASRRLNSQESE